MAAQCPHYEDNQGLCHRCGKPMNITAWAVYVTGNYTARISDRIRDEWRDMVEKWEQKQ